MSEQAAGMSVFFFLSLQQIPNMPRLMDNGAGAYIYTKDLAVPDRSVL
jgi:hypothetical protein